MMIYCTRHALFLLLLFWTSCGSYNDHTGKPYRDSQYSGLQQIPGRLQCEYFDAGGEGIAYHDDDSVNSGSGALNPDNGSYLNEFRINEAVDISYTKFREPLIDNSPYNFVEPEKDQLYVGWTAPGEWLKYTVDVKESGLYKLGVMYTANQNAQISLSVNDNDLTGPIDISSTFVGEDTIAWRQWHHWNYLDGIAEIQLNKGIQVITLHTVAVGQMNYEYIDFKLVNNGN
jgi:hypothetical protein